MLLEQINSPNDLKKLDISQLDKLSNEIRKFLIDSLSKTGGHLSSNLGVVELTLALHYCFDASRDRIVWDVGHQTYTHKIVTGRKEQFDTLRKLDGLSGFPKRKESIYDAFGAGHSSTSISAALGYAKARDLLKEDYRVIAVIGDGSMTGGLAYEALNNAGRSNTDIIVILNDNEMSISPNVGGMAKHLNDIRTAKKYAEVKMGINETLKKIPKIGGKIAKFVERTKESVKYVLTPGGIFNELGFKYVGTIDGHNFEELIKVLNNVKDLKGPVLLHVHTKKGKGYKYAEKAPDEYHSVGSFDIVTGKPLKTNKGKTYSEIFGDEMVNIGKEDKKLVAITAAMQHGTGLDKFEQCFCDRFFDVGIAEAHAVTFSAGLAAAGYKPVFSVYSSFLQRGYDEILHDVCIQNLPVVFSIDRAGIVGEDGETHQGLFDLSFLNHIPNMTVMSPKNGEELRKMLRFAIGIGKPVAIRYPKGSEGIEEEVLDIEYGKSEILRQGKGIALFALGDMVEKAEKAVEMLVQDGYNPMLVNARFAKPIDVGTLKEVAGKCKDIFTIEDNVVSGGFGSKVTEAVSLFDIKNVRIHIIAFPDKFIEQGSICQLFERYNMSSKGIYDTIVGKVKCSQRRR